MERFFILYRGQRFKHREPFKITWGCGFIEFDFDSKSRHIDTHLGNKLVNESHVHQELKRIGFTPLPYN